MYSVPNRASDGGPDGAQCRRCESRRWHTCADCTACEQPCCSECGEVVDGELWCQRCLELLGERLAADEQYVLLSEQQDAKLLCILAESGCTEEEAGWFLREVAR